MKCPGEILWIATVSGRWVVQVVTVSQRATMFCGTETMDVEDFVAIHKIAEYVDMMSGNWFMLQYMQFHATIHAWKGMQNATGKRIWSVMRADSSDSLVLCLFQ
jgi:hypothetical protein